MPRTDTNHVIVSGNLTQDPDLRQTSGGTSVCELRVANNVWQKGGETKANFFQVNAWGTAAENVNKFLSKGSRVLVEGRLDWQMWEKDGKTNSRVVIQAQRVDFIGAPKGQDKKAAKVAAKEDSAPDPSGSDDPDDEVPF